MDNNWLARCVLSLDEDDEIKFNLEFKESGSIEMTSTLVDYLALGLLQAKELLDVEDGEVMSE